jgi:REP element-mobilizing transposase RayT
VAPPGLIYLATNRAAGKLIMHRTDADFAAFKRVPIEAHQREPLRILGRCVMGNHGHLLVWPKREGPDGEQAWVTRTVKRLRLEHAVHREGRPSLKQSGPQQAQ